MQLIMARNKYVFLSLFIGIICAKAETGKYIIYFKNKNTAIHSEQVFTEYALEKRKRFNIALDEREYPVNPVYLEKLNFENVIILNQSNWLNAVLVVAEDKKMKKFKNADFIASIQKVEKFSGSGVLEVVKENNCQEILDFEDGFISSFTQFHLLNGEYLHEQGYNGEAMTIAVCDNGFQNVNSNPAFSAVFSENRMLGTYDYVHNDSSVYDEGSHGASCFSFISGVKSNEYIGTATKSNFYLFHTEDNAGERLQEEFNLATALERCSQLGVDVVSISLGYTTFDVPSENHDTTDLVKNNSPAAIAVNIASSKGMLVCVAAGNQGTSSWKYLTTPSDADSAFAIASVDVNGNIAPSSSYGLANDIRVKPNVAAAGQGVKYINPSNQIATGSGTSYACPSLAGMAACLWQAFPSKTNWEIKTAIEQSASKYLNPDKHYGYGIPDFKKAYQLLSQSTYISNNALEKEFIIYPNPFLQSISINNSGNAVIQQIKLINTIGQTVYSTSSAGFGSISIQPDIPAGIYLLQIATNKGILIKKLMKD